MLRFTLLAVLGSSLISVGGVVVTMPALNKITTPTTVSPALNGGNTLRTASLTRVAVQTPTPTFIPTINSAHNLTAEGAQAASNPFGTSCCGWGGVFGWTADGSGTAQMAAVCPTAPTQLNVNSCLGWDSSTGEVGCPNTGGPAGGFLSAQSGCRIVGSPSVLGINSETPSTWIYVACFGPHAGVLYVTKLDLDLCVGVTTSGQLACY